MWRAQVAFGWNTEAPSSIADIIASHSQYGSKAVFVATHGAHLGGDTEEYKSIYSSQSSLDVLGIAFGTVANFLATIGSDDADGIGLTFINFSSNGPIAKPAGRVLDQSQDIQASLWAFLTAVADSAKPSGLSSICDWATISCTRTPDD